MFSFDSVVRYSEVDKNGIIELVAILNYFQDCSTLHSEDVGIGIEWLKEKNKVWVLSSWQVEILKPAKLFEKIKIGTWSYGANGIYGYRNFVMIDSDGDTVARANSVWVYMDLSTGMPTKINPEDIEAYGFEEALPMTDYGRKLKLEGDISEEESFKVRRYHIDTNGHVNNARYVQFAMEYLGDLDEIAMLRAEYTKPALYGDVIYPVVYKKEKELAVSLNQENGKPYAKVLFILK